MAQKKISELGVAENITDATLLVGIENGTSPTTQSYRVGAKLAEIAQQLTNNSLTLDGYGTNLEWLAGVSGCIYGSFNDGDVIFNHKWVTYSGKYIWVLMWSYSDDSGMVAYKNNATPETEADRLESFDFTGSGNNTFTNFEGRQVPSEFGEMRAKGSVYVWIAQEDFIPSNLYALLLQKADTSELAGYATTEYVDGLVGDVETLLNAL